jgi:hypothetical protein
MSAEATTEAASEARPKTDADERPRRVEARPIEARSIEARPVSIAPRTNNDHGWRRGRIHDCGRWRLLVRRHGGGGATCAPTWIGRLDPRGTRGGWRRCSGGRCGSGRCRCLRCRRLLRLRRCLRLWLLFHPDAWRCCCGGGRGRWFRSGRCGRVGHGNARQHHERHDKSEASHACYYPRAARNVPRRRTHVSSCFPLVAPPGVEPGRPFGQRILNPPRLPFRQGAVMISGQWWGIAELRNSPIERMQPAHMELFRLPSLAPAAFTMSNA